MSLADLSKILSVSTKAAANGLQIFLNFLYSLADRIGPEFALSKAQESDFLHRCFLSSYEEIRCWVEVQDLKGI